MAKLVACPLCGRDKVSSECKSCPDCGHDVASELLKREHEKKLSEIKVVLGKWDSGGGEYVYIFNADGTYRYGGSGKYVKPESGCFSVRGDKIWMEHDSETIKNEGGRRFTVQGDVMKLDRSGTYQKI
jgi:hypothetical protein